MTECSLHSRCVPNPINKTLDVNDPKRKQTIPHLIG